MKEWTEFLNAPEINPLPEGATGQVMVAFLNRFMCPMTGLRYKLIMEGQTIEGRIEEGNFGILLKPKTTAPIEAHVWSISRRVYKRLPDAHPAVELNTLFRYTCDSFMVKAELQYHRDEDTWSHIPRATELTPPAPHGPSPTDNQGVLVEQTRNNRNEPVTIIRRPVPANIVVEQLHGIFPTADTHHLQAIADELNTDLKKYKLDTAVRRAHFFGQIKQEAGGKLMAVEESFNYTPQGLINTFGYYKKYPQEAQQDGREDGLIRRVEWKVVRGQNEPFVYHDKGVIKPADQETIANKVYGPTPGKAGDIGNDLEILGDGWKYRGRGLKQLTGKRNYDNFTNDYKKYWGQDKDILNHPDLLKKMPDMVRSAVWFWVTKNCWQQADRDKARITDEVVDAITQIVNSGEYKKHLAGQYKENANPVLKRRGYAKLAFGYFI